MEKEKKLSTEPYKGVRDFYPDDMFIQNYIFETMRNTVEKFGYVEYGASVIEPSELYRAKSGEEIVNEQTYNFVDRGGRNVTLRPEMTPTVARMVSAKRRELAFPLRWYSIPNLFRYEKPQRGRLREHWQLNVDLFGSTSLFADAELIALAAALLHSFGLKDNQFEIRLNSRKIMTYILENVFELEQSAAHVVSKLIDRKEKMSAEEFRDKLSAALREPHVEKFITLLNSKNFEEFAAQLPPDASRQDGIREIRELLARLEEMGTTNVRFDQTLMRGFDYYTGIIFEIFDTSEVNRRSIFGGGRYDNLTEIFGGEKVPAVGFGTGDVILRDLLETYNLLPEYRSKTKLFIATISEENNSFAEKIAMKLRDAGVPTAVNVSNKKIGDQIKLADRQKIPFVLTIGQEEQSLGIFKIKELATGTETEIKESGLVSFFDK